MTKDGKPETAWDLCELTCDAIAERPLNYYQGSWASAAALCWREDHGREPPPEELCGTAYCRAGWMASLAGIIDGTVVTDMDGIYSRRRKIENFARDLLHRVGADVEDINQLFSGGSVGGAMGTPDHVANGIRGMRAFMAKYEAGLKATPIEP